MQTQASDILIVDDNTDNLRVLTGILKTRGYEVRPVTNGPMALKAIEARSPCLILMDIMMPEMDGFEVCRYLKENPDNREIPLIFITALDALDDKLKAFAQGAVDYITKPFHEAEVLARIETHLSLVQARKELKEKEALHRQLFKVEGLIRMAGAIAHKFNNHLQSVLGNLEMVSIFTRYNPKASRYLDAAISSVEKASAFSRLILTYTGKTAIHHHPINLTRCCTALLPDLFAKLPQHMDMETHLTEKQLTIEGDWNGIQQIVTELVVNAVEATGENGTIVLSLRALPATSIPGHHRFPLDFMATKKNYACLTIRDTGCGIDNQDLESIFDPFFSTNMMGRGMGLSAVLGMVRAHQGAIAVTSKPDAGSVFEIFLPLSGT
ncbi:response regulator [Desulfobotulus sp. H1]|uniref:histidine kinase n=1 Tax=Desulfobotulus pelophilus TaxID=2823377 RepID=A0ABT3N567_9BACT|nr:response regulator [Desulfobotulus pelophilus]MCW7752605.1 response regulator [Desulfobotulus pelophilus]